MDVPLSTVTGSYNGPERKFWAVVRPFVAARSVCRGFRARQSGGGPRRRQFSREGVPPEKPLASSGQGV